MGFAPTGRGGAPPTTTAPPASGGNHYDAQGNWVDANGNVLATAAQIASGGAKDPATGNPLSPPNPNAQSTAFAGNNPTTTTGGGFGGPLGTVVNVLDKDNPVAGTFRAGEDIANGQYGKAAGDFAQGATYGTLPVGGNSVPDATTAVGKLPGLAGTAATGLVNGIGGVLSGAPDPSTDTLSNISAGALTQQQELDRLRQQAEANPTAAPQAGLVQLDQTNIDPLRQRQGVALDRLQAAANGTVPSAADIAGKLAANRAAAQAYGNAAALQGGASSGGALRQALDAQTQLQGDANTQMLINRANEQAAARTSLVNGIQGAQNEEGNLATTNATNATNTNLANQTADVNTRTQDINRENNLVNGANTDTSNATAAAKAALDAKVQEQANANALKGAEIGAAGGIAGKLLSDRRMKTDIEPADMVDLAEKLPGYTFEYKDAGNGPGERVGVMAQDALRSKAGASMVRLDGDKLALDGANAVGAALAMSAQALREAEAAKKKRKG